MSDEQTQDLIDAMQHEFDEADKRGEIKWVKNMEPEEQAWFHTQSLNNNMILELTDANGEIVGYQLIPETYE